jgi:hypothetical protein
LREENLTTPDPILQNAERRLLAFLCIVLALLQLLDLHSTLRAASAGRTEANPIILSLIDWLGFVPAVFLFKAGAVAVVGGYYAVVSQFHRMFWPSISLIPVCAAYLTVVFNNYS